MKIRLKRSFTYQIDARTTETLAPGIHDLDKDLASKVLRFGKAELVIEKKAPQNKARGKASENKTGVARKSKRRRSPRPKSKS